MISVFSVVKKGLVALLLLALVGPGVGAQTALTGEIAYVQEGNIWVRDLATGQARQLTTDGQSILPAWTPDGQSLIFVSGRDGNVKPGQSWTYKLTAGSDSVGVWPYHDHSPSMTASIDGGMYGMLSILGRDEQAPDREFEVVLAPMGKKFMTVDGRAFVGNTPVFHAKVGELVQWDVMALGSDFHTFHVHGHRWLTPGGIARDTQTVGPAESFRFRWREDAPGTWLYHCHVEDHMMRGMIGIYRVGR